MKDGVECEYFSVFDGHGGVDAATYAATHLHIILSQQEALKSEMTTAFKNSFTQTDELFKIKSKRERLRSGSTSVVVFLTSDCLAVAWLGDSQAMLVRQGEPVTVMDPHSPEREVTDQKSYVSNDADSSSVQLNSYENYILMACDGFFDFVGACEVPGLVLEALREGSGSGENTSERCLFFLQRMS
ncbi:protein phosphatase 1F-like [Xyrauchen texanus]|uniref:protein phosphatase 1F-like n=1 Tax=Xyrauchen texanus TaxID=154827 RepID=UPI002241EE0D|nr:protein phosphatase 1F-like [Xyrauchen texanus]